MMARLTKRAQQIAERRTIELIDLLVETAEAELPADLTIEREVQGIAIRGRALARRLAFDGRLRGLVLGVKGARQ
ncbi:MAG: hypothetical protein JWM75_3065 [Sphingomonas bacterium]|nr:hypothetical protein [Sphingomonas bacterium]